MVYNNERLAEGIRDYFHRKLAQPVEKQDAARQKKFRAALEEGNRRYGRALRKLAE